MRSSAECTQALPDFVMGVGIDYSIHCIFLRLQVSQNSRDGQYLKCNISVPNR